jgi:hypothetical protein
MREVPKIRTSNDNKCFKTYVTVKLHTWGDEALFLLSWDYVCFILNWGDTGPFIHGLLNIQQETSPIPQDGKGSLPEMCHAGSQ